MKSSMKLFIMERMSVHLQFDIGDISKPFHQGALSYVSVNSKSTIPPGTPWDSHVLTARGGRGFAQLSLPGGSGFRIPGVMTLHDYGYLPPEVLRSYPVSE